MREGDARQLSRKKGRCSADLKELFNDRNVQLFLGKFLSNELVKIKPIFDSDVGYRYLDVEPFVNDPADSEAFLQNLEKHGLMTRELCGMLLFCPECGSPRLDWVSSVLKKGELRDEQYLAESRSTENGFAPSKDSDLVCRNCESVIEDYRLSIRHVYCYNFSKDGIKSISDSLVVVPVREFLVERGYRTASPGVLIGESEVQHAFDIIAYGVDPDHGTVVIDFHVSDSPGSEEKVIAMFAKVFDTNPFRSVLIAFPGLTDRAKRLAEQYRIRVVESHDISSLFKLLLKAIPPIDELETESLDVMTLLSLPDHLRKTATVVSSIGKGTAEEISERTTRARAVESGYLNQLVRMGYLNKERVGRRVVFSVAM